MPNNQVAFWRGGIPYDAQGRVIRGYVAPPKDPYASGTVQVGGQVVGEKPPMGSGGIGSPYASLPGEDEFYRNRIGDASRAAHSGIPAALSSAMGALESRGLGQSSEVGRTMQGIYGQAALGTARATSDVQAAQFAGRERRINAYQEFLYQKALQKDAKKKSPFDYLFQIGEAIPYAIGAFGGGGMAGSPAGSTDTGGDYA